MTIKVGAGVAGRTVYVCNNGCEHDYMIEAVICEFMHEASARGEEA